MGENSLHRRNASYNRVDGIQRTARTGATSRLLPNWLKDFHERTRAHFLRRAAHTLAPHTANPGDFRAAAYVVARVFFCDRRGQCGASCEFAANALDLSRSQAQGQGEACA